MQRTGVQWEVMLRNDFRDLDCSVARALEVVGERWSLLVLREVFLGVRRFEQIQSDLGIARNVLASRLDRLVDHDVLERRAYQDRPVRHEYRLTQRGLELWPVMVSLMLWGDRHAPSSAGPPMSIVHRDCGGSVDDRLHCDRCGTPMDARSSQTRRRVDLAGD